MAWVSGQRPSQRSSVKWRSGASRGGSRHTCSARDAEPAHHSVRSDGRTLETRVDDRDADPRPVHVEPTPSVERNTDGDTAAPDVSAAFGSSTDTTTSTRPPTRPRRPLSNPLGCTRASLDTEMTPSCSASASRSSPWTTAVSASIDECSAMIRSPRAVSARSRTERADAGRE